MGMVIGRIREAQVANLKRATDRWIAREVARKDNLEKIAKGGVGAADTPKRQIEYATRLSKAQSTSNFRWVEAIIRSNDLVAYAPSETSRAAARPVARIVSLGGDGYQPQGFATGFLVSESGLLLTNWHVFQSKSDATNCGANFRHAEDEHGVVDGQYFELDPDRFFLANEALDFAIVAVKQKGLKDDDLASVGWLRLIEATGKVVIGEPVNIIQHPGGGPRRFAVRNNGLVDILPAGFLHYEADTEPGSSGSPVFSPRWEIIGLHHSGIPRIDAASGLPVTTSGDLFDEDRHTLKDIQWIANEGTRASFIVEALRRERFDDPAKTALLEGLLASTADPLGSAVETSEGQGTRPATPRSSTMGAQFTISGPTTIHVYSAETQSTGQAGRSQVTVVPPEESQQAPTAAPAVRTAVVEKALVFDPDYAARKGYNPRFLGVEVPLPRVQGASAADLYTVAQYLEFFNEYRDVPEIDTDGQDANDPFILHYHHYSLAFNTKHFMCAWTASNCDYRDVMRRDTRTREAFGGESWRLDPRVPPTLQLSNKDVYAPARRVDRGHIVRREDNAWGAAGDETEFANSDTYHYANCTPQHEAFNQENPRNTDKTPDFRYTDLGVRGVWGSFESAVEKQLKDGGGKATLLAGPVLKDFIDVRDWATGEVKTPKRFWKVVIVPETTRRNAKLLAYGYVFDQTDVVKRFGLTYEERLELPAFAGQRKSLQHITELTGVVFPEVVMQADQPI